LPAGNQYGQQAERQPAPYTSSNSSIHGSLLVVETDYCTPVVLDQNSEITFGYDAKSLKNSTRRTNRKRMTFG
jgi:hypothetical protein